ncbi:MAG: SOS response-associated peptidase [Granulosicoccaceae bacterium]
MCGRLNLSDLDGIRQLMADIGLPLFDEDNFELRYNIAPTSALSCLRTLKTTQWQTMHWGMPLANGPLVINARVESVVEKPTFKHLLGQRCLVPINGFYEWQKRNAQRHAWYFEAESEPALSLAALWRETHTGPQLALLTCAADQHMACVHHRMPIAVGAKQALAWLNGDTALHVKPPAMQKRRVGHWVDNAKNQGSRCLDAPESEPYTPDLF